MVYYYYICKKAQSDAFSKRTFFQNDAIYIKHAINSN